VSEHELEAANCAQVRQLQVSSMPWYWEPLVNLSSDESDQVRLCLRRLPLSKDLIREQKKLDQQSAEVGMSPMACSELYAFEHIHAASGRPEGCPQLVIPLALVHAPHAHRGRTSSGRPSSTPAQSDSGTRTPGDDVHGDLGEGDENAAEEEAAATPLDGEDLPDEPSGDVTHESSRDASDTPSTVQNGTFGSPTASRMSGSSHMAPKTDKLEVTGRCVCLCECWNVAARADPHVF
jgi:hypothetical protein